MARQLTLVTNRTEKAAPEKASARIRVARSVLCELLMLDDADTQIFLVGRVSDSLNEMVCQLDSLAGMQELYELWVG